LIDRHVHLQLFVKVVEDWRNSGRELDEMGIHE
jgi:GTPase Era involved in 16S rRNA processing